MSIYDPNNIFAKILRREIPCKPVFEDDHVLAFHDLHPQAPVHILVIPKGDYVSFSEFSAQASADELIAFHRAVAQIVADHNLSETGYRTIANSGLNGGQEVPHYHLHILGGHALGPMLARKS